MNPHGNLRRLAKVKKWICHSLWMLPNVWNYLSTQTKPFPRAPFSAFHIFRGFTLRILKQRYLMPWESLCASTLSQSYLGGVVLYSAAMCRTYHIHGLYLQQIVQSPERFDDIYINPYSPLTYFKHTHNQKGRPRFVPSKYCRRLEAQTTAQQRSLWWKGKLHKNVCFTDVERIEFLECFSMLPW